MEEKEKKVRETKKEEKEKGFDYKHKASFKLSDKFKQRFVTQTAGGPTLSNDGLIALGHVKGMWKIEVDIIQYPNDQNGNMCICKATVGGYDWDPTEEKIIKVEYSDIGDASPSNCKAPVAKSYIRMASTRAVGRALRKYTNMDMLCTEELGEEDISTESMSDIASTQMVGLNQLNTIKGLIQQKSIDKNTFDTILMNTFNVNNFQTLTEQQATELISILENYVSPNK